MNEDNLLEVLQNNGDLNDVKVTAYTTIKEVPIKTKRRPSPEVKLSRWLPPLMGQGTYGIRCEMCWGSVMRNAEGVFVKTPFCPHCGKRMSNPDE